MGTQNTSKHTEPALIDSQCCMCPGHWYNASSHLTETETYSTKRSGFPEDCFSVYPIFAEHTHSKEDFTKVYTIVETFKAQINVAKVTIVCQGFWGPPPGSTGVALKSPTVLMEKWFSSWRKGLCYQEIKFFEIRCLCVPSPHVLFSLLCFLLDIKGLSRLDKTEECSTQAVFFLPMNKMKTRGVHTAVFVLLAEIHTEAASARELQPWDATLLLAS